jgi:polar amino acid transport system substrate-binding protein
MRITGWGVLSILWAATSHAATPLQVAVDDYCPYYCKANIPGEERLADPPGFVIEILQHAFGSGANDINYHFLPWKRSVLELTQGRLDAIVMVTPKEQPELIYPSIEQGRSRGCYYSKINNPWRYTGPASLKQQRLTLISEYYYGEPLDSYQRTPDAEQQISYISGHHASLRIMQMIDRARTDVTSEDSLVATHLLRSAGLTEKIKTAGCDPGHLDFYVGFAPNVAESKARARQLSETMAALRSTGELKKILARYGLNDWRQADAP